LATFSSRKSADGSSEPESVEAWKLLLFSFGRDSLPKKKPNWKRFTKTISW
jgi:hypothetical protein